MLRACTFPSRVLLRSLCAGAVAIGTAAVAYGDFSDNLELYYSFDSDTIGAGGISDLSGNSRDGSPRDDDGSLSISTDVAGAIEVHEMSMNGNTMKMRILSQICQ